jgi:NADPH:quinone reductase-like Zn-dependent oxidoreductase
MLPPGQRLNYLLEIKELMKMGKIKTVIDHRYPLSQMAEAHAYVERGHKKGNIIMVL